MASIDQVEHAAAPAGLQVIFGTGPVGWATATTLLEKGLHVRMVNRTGRPPAFARNLHPNLEITAADAMDGAAVRAAAAGATHVYNCAHARYDQWPRILPVLYETIAAAALEQGAVLAIAQNLYMYARGVPVINEAAPVDPPTRKGRIIARLQEGIEEAGTRKGLRWTAVRASDFYGPGALGQSLFGTERFLDPLMAGKKPMLIGAPDQPHSFTYLEDFGRALAAAALNPGAHGRAWIVPNDRAITTRQMAGLFLDAMGGGPGPAWIPRLALVAAGLFDPVIREIPEMLYQKEEPYVVDGSRFSRDFGVPPTPLEEGVRRTLAWYREWSAGKGRQAHGERAA